MKTIGATELTRPDFVAMTVAAGIAGGTQISAQPVVEANVEIKTPGGTCDAAFIHPASGAHAAGIRLRATIDVGARRRRCPARLRGFLSDAAASSRS